jgi:hypothetical protein
MKKMFVTIGLGAVIVFSPLAAMAQSEGPAQQEQVAQAAPAASGTAHAWRWVSQQTFAPQPQRAQREGARGGRTHAPDAHGAGRSQELTES